MRWGFAIASTIAWPRPLRARPDLVFPKRWVAVFIDGCFWHGCPSHYVEPKANADYWLPKIAGNVRRDRATDLALEDRGWTVLRYWEHEAPDDVAASIAAIVRSRMN
ncbi:very short patch repair protein [Microbacterium phosphatis]|uniref:very short patch repair protein n=1 Tax=Microbacterium phosphatis TaxID=3140248 RepID=UPI0031405708